MNDGTDSLPLDVLSSEVGLSTAADADVVAEGWVRRHFAEPSRVEESIELYESMGFEVHTRKPDASEFGARCQGCASTGCESYLIVYTRPRGFVSPAARNESV